MAKDGSAPKKGLTQKIDESVAGHAATITFRCSHEDQEKITAFAKRTGRRISVAVRDIILHYFRNIDEDLEAAGDWTTAQLEKDDGFVDYATMILDREKEIQKLTDEVDSLKRKNSAQRERFDQLNRDYWTYREALLRVYRHQMKSPNLKTASFGADIEGLAEMGLMGDAGTSGLKPNQDPDEDKPK